MFGAIYGCHFALPWLKENPRGGHIVNVASLAAIMSAPSMAAYNVSKAGVLSLSETLYAELQTSGVGVTVVCPGFVRTNLLDGSRYRSAELKEYAAQAMQNSNLSPEDVAEQVIRAIRRKELYLFLPMSA